MGNESTNGWREYSRFVLAMLERLDEEVKKINNTQEHIQREIPELKNELFTHVDRKFEQLTTMHQSQLDTAKHELADMVEANKINETEVQIATVTGSWEFKTAIATGLVSIAIALIALFT